MTSKKKSNREQTRLENEAAETERDAHSRTPGGAPAGADPLSPGPVFYDMRSHRVAKAPKIKMRAGKPVVRDPAKIDGIVIHQVAVQFGVSDAQLRAAGGDRDLALARRACNVSCHAMAFRNGTFAAATPLRWYVNHGNGFNRRSLGLEVDGLYSGLRDDPDTVPREDVRTTMGRKEPCELDARTLEAAKAALRWLVEAGRSEGMPIRYVWAHRQSSPTRRADPGEDIWRELIEGWALEALGLEAQREVAIVSTSKKAPGMGRPIPVEWSERGVGRY